MKTKLNPDRTKICPQNVPYGVPYVLDSRDSEYDGHTFVRLMSPIGDMYFFLDTPGDEYFHLFQFNHKELYNRDCYKSEIASVTILFKE